MQSSDVEISSMPGCKRLSMKGLLQEVKESMALGVKSFILFPKIGNELKTVWGQFIHYIE
jgi:porphobilinogen synthase